MYVITFKAPDEIRLTVFGFHRHHEADFDRCPFYGFCCPRKAPVGSYGQRCKCSLQRRCRFSLRQPGPGMRASRPGLLLALLLRQI